MKPTHAEIKAKLIANLEEMLAEAKNGVEYLDLENIDDASEARERCGDCLAEGDVMGVAVFFAVHECFELHEEG
jgi:hypothetical protein